MNGIPSTSVDTNGSVTYDAEMDLWTARLADWDATFALRETAEEELRTWKTQVAVCTGCECAIPLFEGVDPRNHLCRDCKGDIAWHVRRYGADDPQSQEWLALYHLSVCASCQRVRHTDDRCPCGN